MNFRYRKLRHPRIALVVAGLLACANVLGHIKNEATQFPDIEFSAARFDIVVLVGAGIIPETPVFEPDKALSNEELASWVALAQGLGRGGENPDTAALAAAALERGIVNSLAGDASVADLNRLFFDGNLGIEAGERTPTKAEAASFIATALGSEVGKALLERRNLAAGVSGDVTEVALEQGHHGNVYVLTIGGIKLQMDEHGRVANGPTDLLQWEGRSVRRSFIRGSGDHAQWMYLEAEPRRAAPADAAPAATGTVTSELVAAAVEEPAADRSVFYWLVAVAVILGAVLFFQRRRSD
ncbi:MAG: hypothetical protein IID58_11625 [Proteobacteria bacterium]|nr:hypothetical protein [Pseudomonadota bacterium]